MPAKSSDSELYSLRLMLVASSYLPNVGGLETVTTRLASGLQQRGHQVHVVAQRYPRHLAKHEEIEGIPVTRLVFLFPRFRQILAGRIDLFLAGWWYLPLALSQLLRQIAQFKPAVVNLHFVGAPALFVLIAHRLLRFRLVVSLHGDDFEGLPRGTRFDRRLFRAILRAADRVTACSHYLLDQALAVEPIIAGKAQVVYNGVEPVDADVSTPAPAEEVVLSAGRLVPKKGFDVLLHAIAADKRINAQLIGDGPEMGRLKSLARELKIEDRVKFSGKHDRAYVLQAMRRSQVVAIPSRQEPFGMTALEAMSMGKPIVASRVGGLPEVLQGADAVLIEPDNANALARAITDIQWRLHAQPDFGARNRLRAEKFSIERMVSQYLEVYQTDCGV